MFWKRLYPVEKLVIIGAVGLPAAVVVFPMFARPRGSGGEGRSCPSNLKQLGLGIVQYTQDADDKFPPVAAGGAAYGWADLLLPYTKSTQILHCPTLQGISQANPRLTGYTDYWFNARLSGRKVEDVGETANLLMCGDGNDGSGMTDARYSLSNFPAKWLADPKSPMFRHEGRANYLFADGHVNPRAPIDVSTLWNGAKPSLQPKTAR